MTASPSSGRPSVGKEASRASTSHFCGIGANNARVLVATATARLKIWVSFGIAYLVRKSFRPGSDIFAVDELGQK